MVLLPFRKKATGFSPLWQIWLSWFVTLALAIGAGAVVIPLIREKPETIHTYVVSLPRWQRVLATFLLSLGIISLLSRLFSPRLGHFLTFFKVPAAWLACLIATIVLCVVDLSIGLGPGPFHATPAQWAVYVGGAGLTVWLYQMATRPANKETAAPAPADISVDQLASNRSALEQWLSTESPADNDLLGNRHVARKLASIVCQSRKTIGLVGRFGSGKSTIVEWMINDLKEASFQNHPEVLPCPLSCWGFEDSATAIQELLSKGLEKVGSRADCFGVRLLPDSYRRTFSANDEWLGSLLDLVFGSNDPMEQLKSLSDILTRVNAKLLFIVEDLDRTTSTRFDREEVFALLERLRSFERISFLLTAGHADQRPLDRLCEHIEWVPELQPTSISRLTKAVRSHCLDAVPHVRSVPDVRVEPDEDPWLPGTLAVLTRFDVLPPFEAAARLLRTPRTLKHVLRRTSMSWDGPLHGEVDFDHLFVTNVLRYSAFEAFQFLRTYWYQLQDDPEAWQGESRATEIRPRLIDEFNDATKAVDWDVRAAGALIAFMLPSAGRYLPVRTRSDSYRLQGIAQERYWLRIVEEQIQATDVRDQTVLHDIVLWRDKAEASSQLVTGLCSSQGYIDVWEHFGEWMFRSDRGEYLVLAGQVLCRLREAHRAGYSGHFPHPAFVALCRRAEGLVARDERSRAWLEAQVREAMRVNLSFANDLYYYWASGSHGIVEVGDRGHVRAAMHAAARAELQEPDKLICVLRGSTEYAVSNLVYPPDENAFPSERQGVEHWKWLGSVLREALHRAPADVALQVAHLISRGTTVAFARRSMEYRAVKETLQGFFGDKAPDIVEVLAQERNRLAPGPDREFLDQVVESAQALL